MKVWKARLHGTEQHRLPWRQVRYDHLPLEIRI